MNSSSSSHAANLRLLPIVQALDIYTRPAPRANELSSLCVWLRTVLFRIETARTFAHIVRPTDVGLDL